MEKNYSNPKTDIFLGWCHRTLKLLLVISALLIGKTAGAQTLVSNYGFAQSAGTYAAFTPGSTLFTTGWDDNVSSNLALPFTFYFRETAYNAVNVSSNGFLTFGAAPAATLYTPISSGTAFAGAISALAFDLTNNGEFIRYNTTGSAPNRVFTVQWTDTRRYSGSARNGNFDFQIKLYESSNAVQVVYGACATTYGTNLDVQVGLRGATNADFNNRATTSNWSATAAGATNAATCRTGTTTLPASGLTFTWRPKPVVLSFSPSQVCQNTTGNIIITGYNFTNATNVSFNGTSVPFAVNSDTQITATLPAGISTGAVAVTTNPQGTGTSATNFIVNPYPAVAAISGAAATCANGTVQLSNTTVGGTWTSLTPGLASVSASGLVTAIASGSATIQYSVTNASGCTANVTASIPINSGPAVSGPASVCVGNTVTLSPASGGTWISNNPGVASVTNAGVVTGLAVGNATFTFTNASNCSGTTNALAVNEQPQINSNPVSASVCSGTSATFSVGAIGAGITYQWYNGATALANGGNISGATSAALTINPVIASDAGANYYVVVSGTCTPAATSANATLTVTEKADITSQPLATQTFCEGQTATFSVNATGSGITYQWFNGTTALSNTGNVSGATTNALTISPLVASDASNNYHVMVYGSSPCGNVDSATAALIVNASPAITSGPVATQTVCSGDTATFSVSASGGTLTYQWFNGATALANGGNISGATSNALSIANTTSADVSSDYHVVVTNGCNSATSASSALTVSERPFIPNQTAGICSGSSFGVTPVNANPTAATIVPSGTTYSWSAPTVTGGITGGSAQSAQTSISQFLTNPTNAPQTATYIVTPTSGTSGNCVGNTFTVTVTVNPQPFIINTSQTACSGTTFSFVPTNGGGNVVPTGTTYSWSLPVLSGPIGGATTGSNQASISQTLTNTTGSMQTATYTVTAGNGSCVGSTFNVVFNVYGTPDITATPAAQTICSGTAMTSIVMTNPNAIGGPIDYSWTRDNTANVTGLAANGFGNTISGTLTNTTNAAQTVTFTMIATSEYGCPSNTPFTATVTVNPKPTVAATPATQLICSGSAITPVAISNPNGVAGTTYSWTRDNASNITGIAASGTGASISGTLVNTTNVAQTTIFTITASAATCMSTVTTVSITVNPQPSVSVTPANQTVCSGIAFSALNISNPNAVPGTTFSWTRNNTATATGLAASGSGNSISGTLVNTTNAAVAVTFTITATSGSCSATTTSQITVNPAPAMTATPASQTICSGTAMTPINFSNTNAMGGLTYSWTRTNTTAITGIANSGTGTSIAGTPVNTTTTTQTTTITFTATAANGCATTTTATVAVYAPMSVPTIGNSQTVCLFSTPAALTQTTPVSGGSGVYAYQWQRSADGVTWTNIAGATGATYTPPTTNFSTDNTFYRLVVTNACGTVTSNIAYIEVVSNVGFTFDVNDGITGANSVCPGTAFTPDISALHFSGSSVRYFWAADGNYITPASGGPVGTTSGAIFGFRTSSASIGPLTTQNNTNASVTIPVTITPNVYNYNGPPSGSGTFICSTTPEIFNVTIRPRPVATISSPVAGITICSGTSASVTVNGNITDDTMYYSVTRTANTSLTSSLAFTYTSAAFNPGQAFVLNDVLTNTSTAVQTLTYTITPRSTAGCVGTAVTILIRVAPAVTPGAIAANQTLCSPADPALFTQTTAATGLNLTYQWYSSTTSATGPWTAISGATATTYDAPAGLTQTTWYIREVTSTVNGTTCTAAVSTPVLVTINNVTQGTIAGDLTICSGDDPPAFTATTPATGTGALTYSWQSSTTGCSGPWTTIPSSNVAAYDSGALTQTTYFRRITTSTANGQPCTATSNCVVITVNQVNGGTVGSDQTLCGNNPDAFTILTAATGSGTLTYQWQSNTAGCASATWNNIPGATGAIYDAPAGLTQTTYYRRVVTSTLNGVSCIAYSNCITVTANSVTPGAIATNQTVCYGGDPAAFTVPVAATGNALAYQWQSSTTSAAGPWTNITGATAAIYDAPAPLLQTTYYQRIVTGTTNSVSCSAASNAVTVFVNRPVAPVMAGSQSVCSGDDPTAFTVVSPASANGALSYQWQSSTTGCSGPWTNIVGVNSATYDPPILAQTTYFQVVITSTLNSASCTANSNCITVSSNGKTWNGSAGTDWNNASNWTPSGVPTAANCVTIPNTANQAIVSGANYVALALNLTVLNGGRLSVNSNNTIEVANFVHVNTGGSFAIADDASLVQLNNVANTGLVSIQRLTSPVYKFDYTYWNSPVTLASNYTLGALSPNTQPDKYYSWTPSISGGAGNWAQESIATVMNPTKGYIVRAPNSFSSNPSVTAPYTANFVGTPNNGTIAVPISKGSLAANVIDDKLNLIGNPYPSAVNADAFLANPTNSSLMDGTLYFWTHHSPPSSSYPDPFYGTSIYNYTASDYATYTTGTGGTATVPSGYGGVAPDGHIATGQSFFVKATASGTAVFDNSMRVRGFNSNFYRQANAFTTADNPTERHRIWLNLANAQGAFSQILVGYVQGATDGKDRNYDGETCAGNSVTFYSTLGDTRLTIQGKAWPFVNTDLVPLGYDAVIAATFTIGIDHLDGLFENQDIYLEDKVLNVIHDLKAAPYSFQSNVGSFGDRFVLRYTNSQLGVGGHELSTGVIAYLSKDKIFAQAPSDMKTIEIFDMTGKKVTTYELASASFEDNFYFAQGVYIARIRLLDGRLFEVKLAK